MTDPIDEKNNHEQSSVVTTAEKLRGLPWVIAMNIGNSIYVQLTFFGSVFVLFLNELDFNKTEIGMTLALLHITGVFSIFIAPSVARFGHKRSFMTFMSARAIFSAFLLFTPLILNRFGSHYVVIYVIVVTGFFAISRTTALMGWSPWGQEYVPNNMRGKFSAISNIFTSLAGFLAVIVAGWVIGESTGLRNFMILFASSLLFAAISVWAGSHVPGGAPKKDVSRMNFTGIIEAVQDKGYIYLLIGVGILTLGTSPLGSFLPLYMREEVGLSSGNAIYIQAAAMFGGILAGYLWGWAADRYGSKPIMLSGLLVRMLVPVFWFTIPRHVPVSLILALTISFIDGAANMGWTIGSGRLLYISIVPEAKSSDYMAVWNAWGGITWGISQLLGGWLLDAAQGISGQLWMFQLDAYTVLFAIAFAAPLISSLLLNAVRADTAVSVGEFASMFLHGNPLMAFNSMIRFNLAKDERTTVSVTELLGQSKSPLTVEELLEALADPRFNVRFEAIISIARRDPDPRLTHALSVVLERGEPALGVVAAWALGRLGDLEALETLRGGLSAPYRSIQAHSARSLGTLQDGDVVPALLKRLAEEKDNGLKVAFTSALGKLGAREAIPDMLQLLHGNEDRFLCMEIALALARIVGDEHNFIRIMRSVRSDPATAASRAVTQVQSTLANLLPKAAPRLRKLTVCAETFAREELDAGLAMLGEIIDELPFEVCDQACEQIVKGVRPRLAVDGVERPEYLILTLHTLESAWQEQGSMPREEVL
ncbi:MAG: MFS transporter [Anaerolineales bacterium]|nr:MFS transporter [Anaerolineales bacterium]